MGATRRSSPSCRTHPNPRAPHESGWKDVVVAHQGMVTRIAVRWAPTDKALNAADMHYPFDPSAGGRGYVWHCHIVDHEDNEMMRPDKIIPDPKAARGFILGTDY